MLDQSPISNLQSRVSYLIIVPNWVHEKAKRSRKLVLFSPLFVLKLWPAFYR